MLILFSKISNFIFNLSLNCVKLLFILFLFPLVSCETLDIGPAPEPVKTPTEVRKEELINRTSESGETLIGNMIDSIGGGSNETGGGGIGVNVHLWKATLDTLAFMPLSSADPFGGVVVTEWYSNTGSPDEKFKIVAYITGKQLRVDALRINVFKKLRNENGDWTDQVTSKDMAIRIENSVLTKAKQYRLENSDN